MQILHFVLICHCYGQEVEPITVLDKNISLLPIRLISNYYSPRKLIKTNEQISVVSCLSQVFTPPTILEKPPLILHTNRKLG